MPRTSVAGTAADPTLQFATLELGGVKRRLAYSYNAIAEAESVSGCNLLTGLENLTELNASQFRGLFYASLKPFDPEMTIEKAGGMILVNTISPITKVMAEAYRLSMPPAKNKNVDPPPAAGAPA